jgi:uncharacterized protein (DUF433 family)
MEWKPYIHSDPNVLAGKPVVRGTRLAVEFIMQLKANGWAEDDILANYPALTQESLRAIFAYAADCIGDESIYSLHANS